MAKPNYEFVRYDVAAIDLELDAGEYPDGKDWMFLVEDWLDRGYKVSMSYNRDNGSVNVSLTGKATGTDDDGKVMSIFKGSLEKCFSNLSYLTEFMGSGKGFMHGLSVYRKHHEERLQMIRDQFKSK